MSRRTGRVVLLGLVPLVVIVALALRGRTGGELGPAEDETWARCQREGVLRVGLDASYPPFEVEEGGSLRGYDVDLAQELGRRLGLKVVFVNSGFDGLYDALAAGRCDVLISALPYEPQRTRDVRYTGGYFNAGQVLITRGDDGRIASYTDLAERRVGVEMGSAAHQEALRLRDMERVALTIEATQTSDEAFDLLQAGKVDAVLADAVTAHMALRARPALKVTGPALTDESYVIAVRRNSPQLFTALNGALDNLRGEGWLEQLAARWL